MAIYASTYESINEGDSNLRRTFALIETPVYGSSRVAVVDEYRELVTENYRAVYGSNFQSTLVSTNSTELPEIKELNNGYKMFEITNHLGNVMAVVSDKRTPVVNRSLIQYFNPELSVSKEYYPFGMGLVGFGVDSEDYRFGFNGQEKVDECTGVEGTEYDFGARIYDARIGRWMSVDPKIRVFPNLSSYVFCLNNPLYFIDPNGEIPWQYLVSYYKIFTVETLSSKFQKDRFHPVLKEVKPHLGIDIPVPIGTEVRVAASGIVKYVGSRNPDGYGMEIVVDHGYGYFTRYAHLDEFLVEVGQNVYDGQVIAKSGNTGIKTGPHLHFEVRKGGEWGEAIDPLDIGDLQELIYGKPKDPFADIRFRINIIGEQLLLLKKISDIRAKVLEDYFNNIPERIPNNNIKLIENNNNSIPFKLIENIPKYTNQ